MSRIKRVLVFLLIVGMLTASCALFAIPAGAVVKHTITFDVQGIGETPDPVTVNDGDSYLYLRENDHGQNPTADGYVFHCWVTTLDYEPDELSMTNYAAYLETPIYEDITLYAVWYKIVDKVDITVEPPKAGEAIGTKRYETDDYSFDYQSPRPNVTVNTEGVRVQDYSWDMSEKSAVWLSDPKDRESTFKGTFEDGKEYGVWAMIEPIFGYQFADQLTITLNGKSLGEKPADDNLCIFTAPIWCGNQPADPKTDIPPSSTVAPTEKATEESTKDQSTSDSSSNNAHAVQTGDGRGYIILVLPVILLCVLVILRRKKPSVK